MTPIAGSVPTIARFVRRIASLSPKPASSAGFSFPTPRARGIVVLNREGNACADGL